MYQITFMPFNYKTNGINTYLFKPEALFNGKSLGEKQDKFT